VDESIAAALHFGQVVRPILTRGGEVSAASPDIATQHRAAFWPRRFIAGIMFREKNKGKFDAR
jgi:hypothetical protein